MTGRKVYAVLTGDLIQSREIKKICGEECTHHLKKTLTEIGKEYAVPFSIFRGDSFQGVSLKPEDALKDAILLRLELISGLDLNNTKTKLDARIAVGIGTVNHLPKDGSAGEGDGEAFQLSGFELDQMKAAELNLIVKTPWEEVNAFLPVLCDAVDKIINGYTKKQAETVMLTLEGITQKEIGERIGVSQSAVSHRLKGTNYNLIVNVIEISTSWIRGQVKLAEKITSKSEEAKMLLEKGKYYSSTFRYFEALNLFSQSFDIYSQINDQRGKADALDCMGYANGYLHRYDAALNSYNQSLVIKQEIGDRRGEARTLHQIGMVYQRMRRYDQALDSYNWSLKIAREIGNQEYEIVAHHQIGVVYQKTRQYDLALDHYNQSLVIARKIGNREDEARTLHWIGMIYQETHRYDQTLDYYSQSLAITQEVGNRDGEAKILRSIGQVYEEMNQYDPALEYYNQSLIISREVGDHDGGTETLQRIEALEAKKSPV